MRKTKIQRFIDDIRISLDRIEEAIYAEEADEMDEDDYLSEDDEDLIVRIVDTSGMEHYATVLACFKAGALDRDYCAVMMHDEEADGTHRIELYRYAVTDNGDGTETFSISNIPSDMEYEDAHAKFDELAEGVQDD